MQTDRELDRVAMLAPHLGNPCADRYEQLGAPSALPLPQLGYRGYAPRLAVASILCSESLARSESAVCY